MTTKRVIIVHRWDGDSETDWYPALRKLFEKKGFAVIVPAMPEPDVPKIKPWVETLRETVSVVDKNTFFVGHSIGCQTIMRFLASQKNACGGIAFVAPWLELTLETDEEKIIAKPWLTTPIDFAPTKKLAPVRLVVFSDDDPFVPLEENTKMFRSAIDPEITVLRGKEHITEPSYVDALAFIVDRFNSI